MQVEWRKNTEKSSTFNGHGYSWSINKENSFLCQKEDLAFSDFIVNFKSKVENARSFSEIAGSGESLIPLASDFKDCTSILFVRKELSEDSIEYRKSLKARRVAVKFSTLARIFGRKKEVSENFYKALMSDLLREIQIYLDEK